MTQTNPQIEAVTLDVDGTLFSVKRMLFRHWFSVFTMGDFFRDLNQVREQLRGKGPFEDFRAEQASAFAARRHISKEQAARLIERMVDQRWMEMFQKSRPFGGLHAALTELSRRGVRLGVISDYPIKKKLAGLGLDKYSFQTLVVSEEVGALKPHPLAFERAAEQLALAPGKVLHVGDRQDCDVAGAAAAGMRTALFGKQKPAGHQADLIFSHWRNFIPQLLKHKMLPVQGS